MVDKMSNRLAPTFIGIGFQRCGTSWLNQVLFEHPEIGKPRSGLHFFNKNFEKGLPWYEEELARQGVGMRAIGEFSTTYSYPDVVAMVATRIKDAYPGVKLIFSIRNPVERCYSDYCRLMRNSEIPDAEMSFEKAIDCYPEILCRSEYAPVLSEFLTRFPVERVHVIRYDDIGADPARIIANLYRFIGVDEHFVPDSMGEKLGASYTMKSARIERAIGMTQRTGRWLLAPLPGWAKQSVRGVSTWLTEQVRARNVDSRDGLSAAAFARLGPAFELDIRRTMSLTGLDLSGWIV
jgi:hypothetical protein